MKYWIFILFVFVACKKDEVAIPTYFQINEIGFNDNINGETSTSKISDVWFYVNDQKQGIYEMPCTFPVIGDGTNNIKIFLPAETYILFMNHTIQRSVLSLTRYYH